MWRHGGFGHYCYRGITTNNAALTATGSLLISGAGPGGGCVAGTGGKMREAGIHSSGRNSSNPKPCWCRYAPAGNLSFGTLGSRGQLFLAHAETSDYIWPRNPWRNNLSWARCCGSDYPETGLPVQVTRAWAAVRPILVGMEKGVFDLYPEYTGAGWNAVLKNKGLYTESLFNQMQAEYKGKAGPGMGRHVRL